MNHIAKLFLSNDVLYFSYGNQTLTNFPNLVNFKFTVIVKLWIVAIMKLAHFSAVAEYNRIDSAGGIIYGVSVITLGNAQGHNLKIDETTLSQILAVAATHKDGIKVKFGNDHKAGVEDTIGALKDFRKDGDKVRADLHLFKACGKRDQIIEMAERIPNEFGLSAVFSGSPEEIEKVKFARCDEIYSVDLVSDPAANLSLFSKKDNDHDEDDKEKFEADGKTHTKACMCASCKKAMSDKNKTKSMSEILTPEFMAELKKLLPDNTAELSKKITELETKQAAQNAEAIKLAKESEINALVAEASKAGKEIPLSDVQLLKMDVADVKEMITKIKPTVNLSKGTKPTLTLPKDNEGKEIFDRHTPEGRAKVVQFCRQKQSENAVALGAEIRELNKQFLN